MITEPFVIATRVSVIVTNYCVDTALFQTNHTYSAEHKQDLFSFILLALHVRYMFRTVLRPSSGMTMQKSYKEISNNFETWKGNKLIVE